MNEVIRAAAALQAVCLAEQWRFCFIGVDPRRLVDQEESLAVSRYVKKAAIAQAGDVPGA